MYIVGTYLFKKTS